MNSFLIVHRVCPHQVTEDSIQWDLLFTLDLVDLIKLFQPWRDATMHGQVTSRDVACNGHRVEDLHEEVVHFDIEALQDLITESKGLSHIARLVVASEQDHILWEVQLDGEEQDADLNAKDASIDVVSQEKVVQAARFSCLGDHVEQVSVLAVDITDDTDGLLDLDKVGFVLEELQSGH